jgi:pimeloyl-ACP methyl ester carboxylesterase
MHIAGARGTLAPVRARQPERCGYAVRDGVRLYYEVFGDGPVTVFLVPPWAIVHSRVWKLQVPYLARHFRVLTYDPRGNGRSDRPRGPAAYDDAELVADGLAVMDEAEVGAAVCVGLSYGGRVLLDLAAKHPDRVLGAVFVAATLGLTTRWPRQPGFEEPVGADEDVAGTWASYNADFWRRDLPAFARFFFEEVFPEAHSTRQAENGVEWAMETDAETLVSTRSPARRTLSAEELRAGADRVECPCLVVQGDRDRIVPPEDSRELALLLGAPLVVFEGCGHGVQARHPVRFNLLVRQFAESVAGTAGGPR